MSTNHDTPTRTTRLYRNHQFPPEIVSYAMWPYHRFSLSLKRSSEAKFFAIHAFVAVMFRDR